MLKLISNSPDVLQRNTSESHQDDYTLPSDFSPAAFWSHFQEISPNLYVFKFNDMHHELSCDITLELKDNFVCSKEEDHGEGHLVPILVGDFPSIDIQQLQYKVAWDEYLHILLTMRFHLKILEQLLSFCQKKDVTYLTLTFGESNLDYMEVFRHFLIAEAPIHTIRGEQTQILILANDETFDDLSKFMYQLAHDFRQNLWRDQKINPAFRQYLKNSPLLEF